MDDISRRQVVGAAAVVGALALSGRAGAENKPKDTFDEKVERQRVTACGLTDAEADCWVAVAVAVGKFFELPKLHPMDDHEVA